MVASERNPPSVSSDADSTCVPIPHARQHPENPRHPGVPEVTRSGLKRVVAKVVLILLLLQYLRPGYDGQRSADHVETLWKGQPLRLSREEQSDRNWNGRSQ